MEAVVRLLYWMYRLWDKPGLGLINLLATIARSPKSTGYLLGANLGKNRR